MEDDGDRDTKESVHEHMCSTRRWLLPALCLILWAAPLVAQKTIPPHAGPFRVLSFMLTRGPDTTLVLPDRFLLPGSEHIQLDSSRLAPTVEYLLDARSGLLTVKGAALSARIADTARHTLLVEYRSLPFAFQSLYRHREPVVRTDTVTGRQLTVAKPAAAFSFDDLFSSNFQKSGSIVRGFSVGTNRDLTLNSGFRMQLSGNLTSDLQLIAALTDENSPIQPEGTTQTLREVDKVFVELRGTHLGATLGDFTLNLGDGEFAQVTRKLQGAKGTWNSGSGGTGTGVMIAGAVTRGKFTTNQLEGLDGVQGPYLLAGENNNRSIIIVAGSERVYVNGERMARGENADYVIDYSNSQLTFTTRRIIGRGTRIVADFEYNDRQFNRSLLAAGTNVAFGGEEGDAWKLNALLLRESDDENNPVDLVLSDQDKDVLRSAGDDPFRAVRPGAQEVGPGKGQYVKIDTLLAAALSRDTLLSVYRYSPQDTAHALYLVTFSNVGAGRGSYRQRALGLYEFVGLGQGSYEPVRFLPMPESRTLADFLLTGHPQRELRLTGEYALSQFDPNRFSTLGDDHHTGSAVKLEAQYSPKNMKLGSLDLLVRERYVGRQFSAPGRTNEVEYDRKWDIADSLRSDEDLREALLTYQPVHSLALSGSGGWLTRGGEFSSKRAAGGLRLAGEGLPSAEYGIEDIHSRADALDRRGAWTRQRAALGYNAGWFAPGVRAASELLLTRSIFTDTLKEGSYRFTEVIPGVVVGTPGDVSLTAEVGWRVDDSLASGSLARASRSFLQHYAGELRMMHSLSSSADLSVQRRTFTDVFHARNNQDAETILFRWTSRYTPWEGGAETDLYYELATERAARMERVFQQVPKGTGNYIYLGDRNGNNVVDPDDFQLTRFDGDFIAVTVPTDLLIPVIDLKTSGRVRVAPSKIPGGAEWFSGLLAPFSSETYLRVEEKNSQEDTRQIYLLHLSHFLNDQTTIAGSNLLTQDLYCLENDPRFSLRLRFAERRGLTQYALVSERTYMRERSLRLRLALVKEISNQTDVAWKQDNLASAELSTRVRGVSSGFVTSDWSYRPEQRLELGFVLGGGSAQNFDTLQADINTQSVRLVYSFEGKGQLRAEMAREEVVLSRSANFFPFELTDGRAQGLTWLWHLTCDYRLTQFIQASLSYDGRSERNVNAVHTARAEVRAFF
jgi:hypothetical protein